MSSRTCYRISPVFASFVLGAALVLGLTTTAVLSGVRPASATTIDPTVTCRTNVTSGPNNRSPNYQRISH